ncbi:flagellar hook protein FlgE [Actinoplanes sp. KI2]|uniref:flagellar hook protein FlgE n=1 Tax=Actinoplanes sp. KI2 TaxID=2983315 RepID=UPI0021D57634|nr:flagellar hook protein FlgE [Actinoplanes sp. KI2]MCU7727135.1 flagellar hook protein FlgE [Actinoplanes sp. KI2]
MLRSLYSGISGLRAHQQMMDVTGNNIANVNTVGYKASSVQFQDTLSQMIGSAGAPQNGGGGTNPAQIGLGVRTAGIVSNWAQGSTQTTGRSGDMMISGDGFFVVRSGGEDLYTRAGSFSFDANGTLVTADGKPVQGWNAVNGVVNAAGQPGDIKMPLGSTVPPAATSKVTLRGNLTSDRDPDPLVTSYSTTIPVKVFDATGATRTVTAKFTNNYPAPPATTSSPQWSVDLIDSDGVTPIGGTLTLPFLNGTVDQTPPPPAGLSHTNGRDLMTFGAAPNQLTLDVTDMTMYSGQSDARVFTTDGQSAGALTSLSYNVSDTGQLVGVYSNGQKMVLGQLALATFTNPNGLEKTGDSNYRSTVNSGYAQVGQAGAGGMGSIISGAVEMSNVDLAQEFTNLVIAQRGFQANSRVITTSDEILQELVSMKR